MAACWLVFYIYLLIFFSPLSNYIILIGMTKCLLFCRNGAGNWSVCRRVWKKPFAKIFTTRERACWCLPLSKHHQSAPRCYLASPLSAEGAVEQMTKPCWTLVKNLFSASREKSRHRKNIFSPVNRNFPFPCRSVGWIRSAGAATTSGRRPWVTGTPALWTSKKVSGIPFWGIGSWAVSEARPFYPCISCHWQLSNK